MITINKLIIPLCIAIFLFGCSEKANEPTVNDLTTALKSTLPSFIKVDNLEIDVSESVGTKTEAVVKSTFKGKLSVIEDLYMDSALLSNKMVLRKIYAKESEFNLSGLSTSTFKVDKWKVNFKEIKISPEPKGTPLSNFAKNTFVISGSEEEKRMLEEQEQQKETNKKLE